MTEAKTEVKDEAAAPKEAVEAKAKVAKAKEEAAKKKPPFYVAPGKSITTKTGIKSGDTEDEIKATDLSGGKEALDAFVKSGHILKG